MLRPRRFRDADTRPFPCAFGLFGRGANTRCPDLDGDLADNDSAESEVADGNAEEEADTDGEVSEPASSAVPLFNGFSAAAGSMASRSYQLTFSFAPAALATPTVSNNGSGALAFYDQPAYEITIANPCLRRLACRISFSDCSSS